MSIEREHLEWFPKHIERSMGKPRDSFEQYVYCIGSRKLFSGADIVNYTFCSDIAIHILYIHRKSNGDRQPHLLAIRDFYNRFIHLHEITNRVIMAVVEAKK